jgi:hypothetical protein
MKQLSKHKIESLLAQLYWDTNVKPGDLYRLLEGEIDEIGFWEEVLEEAKEKDLWYET